MERNKCINIDCIEGFKKIHDDTFDLVLTDPPYGVRSQEEWDNKENFLKNIDLWLQECLRVSKSTVIWFCANKMLPYILKNKEELFHRLLIWNKPVGSQFAGAQNNNIWYSMEPILVFSKNLELTKSKGKKAKYGYSVLQQRTIPKSKFNHPTTKAEPLMRELIMHYSDEGDFILDPFSGSGSTLVSAKQLNRDFLGFELDKEYCNTINNRISQETLWTAFDNTQAPTKLESFNIGI
jgi:site-specific DNA-methyltransferase (adenine-specific)